MNDKHTFDEIDGLLQEIDASTQKKADNVQRIDLEHRETPKSEVRRVRIDVESASNAPVRIVDEPDDIKVYDEPAEDGVRVFESTTPAVKEEVSGATQVISVVDADEEPKRKKKDKVAKKATKKAKKAPKENEDDEVETVSFQSEALGCLKAVLYIAVVVGVAVALALFIYRAAVDFTGIGRSMMSVDIKVPDGATTADVAEMLEEKDIIEDALIFRVYCRVMGVDGTFHPGIHTVAANMGYDGLVTELQVAETRQTATVTFKEGSTVEEMAKVLQENNVCTTKDFYTALVSVDYGTDYDFIAELTAEERQDRVYLLEGYLFPDTYEFYLGGAAETVIRTMLDNFATRINEETRASIEASGKTLNEILIEASIVQMEAGKVEDMPRVMRVLQNRLDAPDEFPYLQMDSTGDYLAHLMPTVGGVAALDTAYNTYVREGLPVGPICNPGLDAINAALNPSQEEDIVDCYYFASIVSLGTTEFFETFEEHEDWCIEHGVGMYG